ncbi:MAG: hypothetical protein MI754_08125 [Chromatiales bacterium]|nr:hypothetical protein [Chromatiales bacterium]
MSFFRLTIAEDEIAKKTEGYRNLMSMLYGFTIAFSVTLVSGFWYAFFPRDINWNASQTVLILHLAGGVMSLFLFIAYFFLHQQDKKQRWYMLLMPWKLRQEEDETGQHFRQRQLGHLLTWMLLVIYATGLTLSIPGLLFYLGTVWMQGYYTSQTLIAAHLWGSVLLIPLLFTHMLWIARRGS